MNSEIFSFKRAINYLISDIKSCISNFGLNFLTICLFMPIGVYLLTILYCTFFSSPVEANMELRSVLFVICVAILVIRTPTNCYGKITDKKYGSFFLSIPASTLEKYISMVLISAIIIPICGLFLFLFTDSLLCLFDPRLGESLFKNIVYANLFDTTGFFLEGENIGVSAVLMLDDYIGACLLFLLGALVFKKNKTAYTILSVGGICYIVVFLILGIFNLFNPDITTLDALTPYFTEKNLILLDSLNDGVINIVLLLAIYLKLKRIKH